MPARLTRPTVGLMPTTPHADAGLMIEPTVSVPMAAAARLAATATAEPAAAGGGLKDGPGGAGPEGGGGGVGREGGGGAGAGAVARAIEDVRVARATAAGAPPGGRARVAAVRPFAQVRLAEDDRARA